MSDQEPPQSKPNSITYRRSDRAVERAARLRDNLKRRKAQARARTAAERGEAVQETGEKD